MLLLPAMTPLKRSHDSIVIRTIADTSDAGTPPNDGTKQA